MREIQENATDLGYEEVNSSEKNILLHAYYQI